MKLFYHKTSQGNVGDDLNAVLWPRLLPQMERLTMGDWLIGIGTIIDQRLAKLPGRKIVAGAGYRPGALHGGFENDLYFSSVRGPLSADRLGLAPSFAVCDPAFAVSRWPEYQNNGGKLVALIPHVYSETWTSIADRARDSGLEVISPRLPVGEFLTRLARCGRVYCEAMHGAILADALRVPWTRVKICSHHYEGRVSDFKWEDTFSVFGLSTQAVNRVRTVPMKRSWPRISSAVRPVNALVEHSLVRWMLKASGDDPLFRLSHPARLQERVDTFLRKVGEMSLAESWSEPETFARADLLRPGASG